MSADARRQLPRRAEPGGHSPLALTEPALDDVLFSLKTFGAAMASLFIALRFSLQNPYWAMATVYIVSHPLSGASSSKAVYRLLGTCLGGAVTLALLPVLSTAPELLIVAVAMWIVLCLAVSLVDRTPRAYLFMLAVRSGIGRGCTCLAPDNR